MFGWGKGKRRKKGSGSTDLADGAFDVADGCVPDGCGCDLPLIAFIVMAGPLLYLLR